MENDRDYAEQLQRVRPVTRNLVESIMLDKWPNYAAVVDFGLDSQEHFEAIYYPVRAREIMPETLDRALGHGSALTAIMRLAPSNPHKDIEFHTSWDVMRGAERAVEAQERDTEPER